MNFIQSIFIVLFTAGLSAIMPIINYVQISEIEHSIKNTNNISDSLELYNFLAPSVNFSIGRMALLVNTVPVLDSGDNERNKEVLQLIQGLKDEFYLGNISPSKMIANIRNLQKQLGGRPEDVIPVIMIWYCVENLGRTELDISTPKFSFIVDTANGTSTEYLDPYKSTAIGGLMPGKNGCSYFKIKFSDFRLGGINYLSKVTVRPAKRSLKFIFKDKTDIEIKEYGDSFSYDYIVNGFNEGMDIEF